MKGRRRPKRVRVRSDHHPITGSVMTSNDLASAVKNDRNARLAPCRPMVDGQRCAKQRVRVESVVCAMRGSMGAQARGVALANAARGWDEPDYVVQLQWLTSMT